jgi:hypothetical protein
MNRDIFIQYIIRKAVIVFITAFLGGASLRAPLQKENAAKAFFGRA